jgi:hypothetical protein
MDRTNPANELIIRDETVTFKDTPGTWRKLTARAPDSDAIHILLTNEMTLPPGVLSECYRLRWRIEKAFDQQEQKLDERKAWAKSDTAKTIQAIAICLAHNLLQLFNATLKAEAAPEDTKVITAYHKALDRRAAKAKAAGRAFPKALYLALYRLHGAKSAVPPLISILPHAGNLLLASPGPPTPPYDAIPLGFLWTGFSITPKAPLGGFIHWRTTVSSAMALPRLNQGRGRVP